jgi:hypothetical protein
MVSADFGQMNGVGWALSCWTRPNCGLEASGRLEDAPADNPFNALYTKGRGCAAVVFTTAQSNITS